MHEARQMQTMQTCERHLPYAKHRWTAQVRVWARLPAKIIEARSKQLHDEHAARVALTRLPVMQQLREARRTVHHREHCSLER